MEFLVEAAQSFHSHGYSDDACSICHTHMDSTHRSPQLLAVELEILGSMKQPDKIQELIDKVCDLFNILALIYSCSHIFLY